MSEIVTRTSASNEAKHRLLALPGDPLFYARWDRVVFFHYECQPDALQRCVPFPLDLYEGRAFVSVVAFTMVKMRPRFGGAFAAALFRPIATHHFLNVRTYVRHDDEPGIYFIAEWLSNGLSVLLGPVTYGLPYRFGQMDYDHADRIKTKIAGSVRAKIASLNYRASLTRTMCERPQPESLSDFLLERYTAYTSIFDRKRFFRIWHEPWKQTVLEEEWIENNLWSDLGLWSAGARYHFVNYSPGVDVCMGWPHRLSGRISYEHKTADR